MKIYKEDLRLIETCGACPEQYDVFRNGVQVAYLRLRHGYFRVDVPDCGGETILGIEVKGDGSFYDDEREMYLEMAMIEICNYYNNREEEQWLKT